jgi:Fe-S cluster assembly protein SufA
MSVETFDINDRQNAIVSISTDAAEHFRKQVDRNQSCGIRISLEEAGCTGYKYVIDETDVEHDGDLKMSLENGVDVFIDSRYVSAIQGTQIDIRQQGLNLNLVMENPNVKDECGCGESFSIENKN